MTEKTCQILPLGHDNIKTKCPCCGAQMKLVMTIKSDGLLHVELQPAPAVIDQKHPAHSNNSLMNIVSVSAAENRHKDDLSPGRIFSHHPDGCTASSSSNHNLNSVSLDDNSNDAHINDSNSSSLSNNSMSRNFVTVNCQNPLSSSSSSLIPLRKEMESQSHLVVNRSNEMIKHDLTSAINHHHHYDPFRSQVNPSSSTRLKCEVSSCGQYFANSQQLDLHYKEHKGEKIQKCDWQDCNRLFSSKEKLRNHIRCRHTGERPYKCNDCDKAFTSPKHLKDHRLLHTDERPFGCDWEGCNLRFRRRHHLVAHQRVHTKERPYNCPFDGCDMRFTKSHHVKRHYETHFKYRGPDQVATGSVAVAAAAAALLTSHVTSAVSSPLTGTTVPQAAACSPLPVSLISGYAAFPVT